LLTHFSLLATTIYIKNEIQDFSTSIDFPKYAGFHYIGFGGRCQADFLAWNCVLQVLETDKSFCNEAVNRGDIKYKKSKRNLATEVTEDTEKMSAQVTRHKMLDTGYLMLAIFKF